MRKLEEEIKTEGKMRKKKGGKRRRKERRGKGKKEKCRETEGERERGWGEQHECSVRRKTNLKFIFGGDLYSL